MFTRPHLPLPPRIRPSTLLAGQRRLKSNSPYGRSHVTPKQKPALPPPVVGHFPQLVIASDGSTFTQYTTSPRGTYKLSRDIHNNPLWYVGEIRSRGSDEEELGRMGRFRKRFAGLDSSEGEGEEGKDGQARVNKSLFREGGDMAWLEEASDEFAEPDKAEGGEEAKQK